MSFDLKGIFKNAVSGGLAKLGDSAKGIIQAVAEGKLDKMEALAQIEAEKNRHEEAIVGQSNEIEKAYLADIGNARSREVEMAKVTGHGDRMNWFLAIIVMSLLIFITISLSLREIPKSNEHVLILIIGEILGFAGGIFTYQFGSSFGSRLKDMKQK